MAGSSSDLHSVRQIWLTVSQIIDLNIPGIPKSSQGVHKYLKRQLIFTSDSVRRKRGVQGNHVEYRADLLPIHAKKSLFAMQSDSQAELSLSPAPTPIDILFEHSINSGDRLFSSPSEMVDDGLNLLSVLNRFVAATDDFNREDLGNALMHAEGLIRAGYSLSKSEGGAV